MVIPYLIEVLITLPVRIENMAPFKVICFFPVFLSQKFIFW
jgi:hypothetical protein